MPSIYTQSHSVSRIDLRADENGLFLQSEGQVLAQVCGLPSSVSRAVVDAYDAAMAEHEAETINVETAA